MSRSPFQRFVEELRRRHVPQTAAIYLVAAWAAIEFSDVVVPNLNGPQWIVTAVIVAALVGFPVMLVVAWIFEWGPEGLHRTEDADVGRMEAPPSYDPETGLTERPPGRRPVSRTGPTSGSQPWLAALTVLVVGIGSALGVAYVLRGDDGSGGEGAAPAVTARDGGARGGRDDAVADSVGARTGQLPPPPVPGMGELGNPLADSVGRRVLEALTALDTLDLSSLAELGHMGELGREAAVDAGLSVLIIEPRAWRGGEGFVPVQLAEGDTMRIRGVAVDSAGVVAVALDGETLVEASEPTESVPFNATVIGRGAAGFRPVAITVRTADGRELVRTFQIVQMPGGTP